MSGRPIFGNRSRITPERTATRPDPRFAHWSEGDLARRRALVTARAELGAAEMRGDAIAVVEAWIAVIAALSAAEKARVNAAAGEAVDG